ncbi:hypothetical protein NHJ6243_001407 [Beauveria neobassiana]
MPRPKVHPSQRKRAAEACNFCRMSKKKCSATVPCTACQRRGIGHTCYLTHSPRASRSTAHRVQASLGDGSPATDALSAGRRASGAETVWPPGDSARCWVPPEPVIPALVFAAGLILGFDMFAKRELDVEIESAFAGAREILDFIAEQSSQAAHYAEILGLLSSAIAEQRRKTASQGRSKLVSRLFSSSGDDATAQGDDVSFRPSEGASQPAGDRMLPDGTGHWLLGQPPTLSAELESDFIEGWDVLDLSQWDNFPFNSPRNFANEG